MLKSRRMSQPGFQSGTQSSDVPVFGHGLEGESPRFQVENWCNAECSWEWTYIVETTLLGEAKALRGKIFRRRVRWRMRATSIKIGGRALLSVSDRGNEPMRLVVNVVLGLIC